MPQATRRQSSRRRLIHHASSAATLPAANTAHSHRVEILYGLPLGLNGGFDNRGKIFRYERRAAD